jgi:3-oxoacyl-[acyl-carrier protein] reductase
MRLAGKVGIVTASAGAGIGQATVRTLAREGASVVVSDIHERRTKEVTESLISEGHESIGIVCDVSKWDQVESMVKQTLDTFGRIDILVNNAAREIIAPIVDTTEDNWDLIMNVCLKGTFFCTKAVLPTMMSQKSGAIVNMASVDAYIGNPFGECAYCSAKAGITGFTRVTAAEGAQHNIRANAIAPGVVPNPYLEKVYPQDVLQAMENMSLFKRGARPEEMANIIAFLVSDEASYITGEVINASAGMYWSP